MEQLHKAQWLVCAISKGTAVVQEESVQYVASTVAKLVQDSQTSGKRRLFLIQTYVIGKERVLLEVRSAPGSGFHHSGTLPRPLSPD